MSRDVAASRPRGSRSRVAGGGGVILARAFYDRPVLKVARDLLGMRLVREDDEGRRLSGVIVEVEAYDGIADKACHASRGLTRRTEPLFGEPGHAYVYLIYGMHYCLNVVTGPAGYPAAVLIRAVEPTEGLEWMDAGRTQDRSSRIASGPGRLARALRVDGSLNRLDMCARGPLYIEAGGALGPSRIVRGERIGVAYAGEWARKPWRLAARGSPAISKPFGRSKPG